MNKICDLPNPIYARPDQTFHTQSMAIAAGTVAMALSIMMKPILFEAAHTYIAHVRKYNPPGVVTQCKLISR